MLPLVPLQPKPATLDLLAELQAGVDAVADYTGRITAAAREWARKSTSREKKAAFGDVRDTLGRMCTGPRRCHYCEDSQADEIEHVRPKTLFPEIVFVWDNFLFACGPCNGPKGNRYGYVLDRRVEEFRRGREIPLRPPPPFPSALIDPRQENPMDFLELDLGGVAPDGLHLQATFEFRAAFDIAPTYEARAKFTIDVLGLNRQVLLDARRNAFSGFRARLQEYRLERAMGDSDVNRTVLRNAILATPHLTVFAEMRRQARFLPFMRELLGKCPEVNDWQVVQMPPDP